MEYLAVRDVELPDYEKNEELLNTVTHAAGAVMAAFVLVSGLLVAVRNRKSLAVPSCCIYGLSMICYIVMGWLVAAALKPTIAAPSWKGFAWLLAGGVCYTVGAVLYKTGKKKRYFHTVFHVFVVLASLLQAVCILRYVF